VTVSKIAACFDLVLGVGNGGGATLEAVGVVVLGIVCVGLAQKATADVVIPFGAIALTIVKILQCTAVAPVEAGGAVERIYRGHALTQCVIINGPSLYFYKPNP